MSKNITNDLEYIYTQALKDNNLSVALRAKELLAKHYHFFDIQGRLTLDRLGDEEIESLINEIKEALAKGGKK